MAGMLKASEWMTRIHRIQEIYRPHKERADRYKLHYTGCPKNRKNRSYDPDSSMQVNFIFALVETILPTIFSGDPQVLVTPKNPQSAANAENSTAWLNYWGYELNMKRELERIVFDRFFGPGAATIGWNVEREIQEIQGDGQSTYDKEGILIPFGATGKSYIYKRDEPMFKRKDFWNDILCDIDVPTDSESRFKIVRNVMPIEEFRMIDSYSKAMKRKVKPQARPKDVSESYEQAMSSKEMDNDLAWVVVYEVWDRLRMRRYHITPDVDDYLLDDEWPHHLELRDDPYPIQVLRAQTDPFSPLSFSEFQAYESQIEERDRLRTLTMYVMKRMIPKLLANESVDDEELQRFQDADPNEVVKMKNPAAIQNAPDIKIPPDFFNWDTTLSGDLSKISGLNEFEQQLVEKTATESQIDASKQSVRKSKRNADFESFVADSFGKMLQLGRQYQNRQIVTQIPGVESPEFLELTKEQIQGEFDVRVEPGSMEHVNEMLRQRSLIKFSEVYGQHPLVNQRYIIREAAKIHKLDPDQAIITEEQQQQQSEDAEPTVDFEKIKLEDMDPASKREIIQLALKQHGLDALNADQQAKIMDIVQSQAAGDNGGVAIPGTDGMTPEQPVQTASEDSFNG